MILDVMMWMGKERERVEGPLRGWEQAGPRTFHKEIEIPIREGIINADIEWVERIGSPQHLGLSIILARTNTHWLASKLCLETTGNISNMIGHQESLPQENEILLRIWYHPRRESDENLEKVDNEDQRKHGTAELTYVVMSLFVC